MNAVKIDISAEAVRATSSGTVGMRDVRPLRLDTHRPTDAYGILVRAASAPL
ncbi:hypothetical protein [Sinosporangium album]|nr:hypothetical protein [Sinosporangium album]